MKKIFKKFAAEPTFSMNAKKVNLPFFYKKSESYIIDEAVEWLEYNLKTKFRYDHPWFRKAYEDSSHLEIPSTIYSSKQSFLKDYKNLCTYLKDKFQFVPSSCIDMETEGGCHLNVTMPRIKNQILIETFFYNFRNFIIGNPSIVWSFLAPTDNQSSVISMSDPLMLCKGDFMTLRDEDGNTLEDMYSWHNHNSQLYNDVRRIELRFFVMPKTVREMELHVDFAMHLLNWVWNITNKGKRIIVHPKNKKSYTADYAVNELKEACSELGFDYGRLVAMGKINNLKERFEYSKKYLV